MKLMQVRYTFDLRTFQFVKIFFLRSNLIKGPTCFKSANESMIDLFLTTNKYLFQNTNSFETRASDHHHLIATVLKTTYVRFPPKLPKLRTFLE